MLPDFIELSRSSTGLMRTWENPPSLKNIPGTFGPRSDVSRQRVVHSALMLAALISGHHFSISAFWNAPSACGLCWSNAGIS